MYGRKTADTQRLDCEVTWMTTRNSSIVGQYLVISLG
jgi:hypothetical protein